MSEDTGRRLILQMSVSLDGFAARRDHQIDWLTPEGSGLPDHGDQRHRLNLELLSQVDLIVLGRRGYEDMYKGWSGSDNPMAQLMNSLPKLVFSQSLEDVEWNASLSRRPVEEEIPERKREGGKDMVVFGGARIANSLIRERLVDEYRLTIHPVALGEGLPLMHGLPEPQRFELVSSTAYADGTVAQVLRTPGAEGP